MEVSSVEDLAKQVGADWPFIRKGRENSRIEFDRIKVACKALVMPDTSLVVFGSLARGEFTDGSDIDWTLLVDGITIPQHLTVAGQIAEELAKLESKPPGENRHLRKHGLQPQPDPLYWWGRRYERKYDSKVVAPARSPSSGR